MHCTLRIFSKDKTLLNNFLLFLYELQFPVKIISNSSKFQKKKIVTVLKSPHVNKDAQEQFEFRIYSKKLLIQSTQLKLFILILKRAIRTSFSGVKLQVNFSMIGNNNQSNLFLNILNPNSYNLNFFEERVKNRDIVLKKVKTYLNVSDCYGEISFKK